MMAARSFEDSLQFTEEISIEYEDELFRNFNKVAKMQFYLALCIRVRV